MEAINKFGAGEIYTIDEVIENEITSGSKVLAYCTSTACMSVTSDLKSWVSKPSNLRKIAFVSKNSPKNNSIIIVLGCQVTDLAILNDIKTAERLHEENPSAKVYMGGCLAYRFDIELPSFIKRLAATRSLQTEISARANNLIHWENPFWVKDWNEEDQQLSNGHIFRDMYPLKIGAGCHGKCKYCTIRDTRGETYEEDAYLQVREFLNHDNVVLISDSPTYRQINDWCNISKRYNKPISIRNIEPTVAWKCSEALIDLAYHGLLRIFHCPIQSNDKELLKIMGRSVEDTMNALYLMEKLRMCGVKVATNIIIDYTANVNGEEVTFHNMDIKWLNEHFDYWSWNPYFDGKWDREKAEERWKEYLS